MIASGLKYHKAMERAELYSRLAVGALIYNLLVIVFGAFVRATGSGAGCGGHWPSCQGVIIPIAPQINTIIEFTHRVTSGITVVLSIVLVILAWRVFGKGHPVRLGASLVVFFTFTEALIGAGLVLLGLVGNNQSVGRAVSQALHLSNTLLLLGSLFLTVWWSSGRAPFRLKQRGRLFWLPAVSLIGLVILDITGAITALGDTLYPAQSLAAGLQQDITPGASFLIHLRVYHPILAVTVAVFSAWVAGWIRTRLTSPRQRQLCLVVIGLFALQLAMGAINVILLAPVWMQLAHLFVADLVWLGMFFVLAMVVEDPEKIPGLRLVIH